MDDQQPQGGSRKEETRWNYIVRIILSASSSLKSQASSLQPPASLDWWRRFRRPMLVALAITGILASGWILSLVPRQYSARAGFDRVYLAASSNEVLRTTREYLKRDILEPELLSEVLQELGGIQRDIKEIQSRIHVQRRDTSNDRETISIQLFSGDPEFAQRFVDLLVQKYVERRYPSAEISASKKKFSQKMKNLNALGSRLEEEQQQLEELSERIGIPSLKMAEAARATFLETIEKLQEERSEPRKLAIDRKASLPHTSSSKSEPEDRVPGELRELIQLREELARTFTEEHPKVVRLDGMISNLANRIGLDIEKEKAALALKFAGLALEREDNSSSPGDEDLETRLAKLQRRVGALDERIQTRQTAEQDLAGQRELIEALKLQKQRALKEVESVKEDWTRLGQRWDVRDSIRPNFDEGPKFEGPYLRRWYLGVSVFWLMLTAGLAYLTTPDREWWHSLARRFGKEKLE